MGRMLTKWILANGVGMALGFLAFVQVIPAMTNGVTP